MRPLVHIIQDRVLRPNARLPANAHVRRGQPHLDHVSRAHAPAFAHAVDERLVEVQYQRLLVASIGRLEVHVTWLAARYQRPRRGRRPGVFGERTDGRGRGFELGRDVIWREAAVAGADGLGFLVFPLSEGVLRV